MGYRACAAVHRVRTRRLSLRSTVAGGATLPCEGTRVDRPRAGVVHRAKTRCAPWSRSALVVDDFATERDEPFLRLPVSYKNMSNGFCRPLTPQVGGRGAALNDLHFLAIIAAAPRSGHLLGPASCVGACGATDWLPPCHSLSFSPTPNFSNHCNSLLQILCISKS